MNKDKIKLLALDLDGTTLTDGNALSPAVKASIEYALSKGIEVVIASGRPFGTMPDELINLCGINYVITSNGAAIFKNKDCVHRSLLNPNDVLKLLEITEPYDLIFEAFINGLTYTDLRYVQNPGAYGCSEAYFDYVRSAHGQIDDMRKFIYEHRCELDSIEFIETDSVLSKKLWKQIESAAEGFYITSSTSSFVEFMNKNATKAAGVEWVCRRLGIRQSETAACGNADNDADMIIHAGLGAAVANASTLCKQNADIIVPPNSDDGVVELIKLITGD